MPDPIMDDGAFRTALDAKYREILTLFIDLELKREFPPTPPGYNGPPGSTVPEYTPGQEEYIEAQKRCAEYFDERWRLVAQLQDASANDAEADMQCFKAAVEALELQALDEFSTALEDIRWKDSEAAKLFSDYLGDLEDALQYQYNFAVSMYGLMNLHRELIFAVREGLLEVCAKTLAKLGAEAERRESERRKRLGGLVGSVFEVGKATLEGGPIGGLKQTVEEFGRQLAGFGVGVDGDEPKAIIESMMISARDLRRNAKHEENILVEGFDQLEKYTGGDDVHSRRIVAPLIPG